MMKHQKYVSVSSCTLADETSEICCEYLVLEYTRKHQKYVAVSSFTVHEETSEICVNI
jgi:hypothetical protein